MATKRWKRNFEFLARKLFRAPKSKKKIEKFFLTLEGSKEFGGKNSKFRFQRLVANLVVWIMPQIASRYLENCRGEILREPLKFSQKLEATLQTGNSIDFQNILNQPSNRCL